MKFWKRAKAFLLIFCLLFLVACGEQRVPLTLSASEVTLAEYGSVRLTSNHPVESWSSSDPSVASVSADGVITAAGIGQAVVTASADGQQAACVVTVVEDTVTLSQDTLTMILGESYALSATVGSGRHVIWSSDNNQVVTVDNNGKVLAAGVGTAKIRADVRGGLRATCQVTVVAEEVNLHLSAPKSSLSVGESLRLSYSMTVLDRQTGELVSVTDGFVWQCSDPQIASVQDGEVKALGGGKVTISVTHEGWKGSAECELEIIEELSDFDFTNAEHMNVYGRVRTTSYLNRKALALVNTGSGFELQFSGSEIRAVIASTCTLNPGYGYLKVFVDGEPHKVRLDKGSGFAEYTLASGLGEGLHVIRGYKVIEEDYGTVYVAGFSGEDIGYYPPPEKPRLKIEVYGDSITAGYGVLGSSGDAHTADFEDGTETYAFLAAEKLGAQVDILCMQGISLAVPGWRTDIFMKDRFCYDSVRSSQKWDFPEPADVVVIHLGTNDNYGISQGKGTSETYINGYRELISGIREVHPDALILCCYGMMSGGAALGEPIEQMVQTYQQAGDEKICALSLIVAWGSTIGAAGHPGAACHKRNSEILANTIAEVLGL